VNCPVCPRQFKPVLGRGPCPARYLAIGERPGLQEMKQGIPFVGPSGQEWNQTYLPLAGLSRVEVFVTNTVKCFAKGDRTPNAKEISGCAPYWLPGELQRVQPETVFLMGSVAASLIPGLKLETDRGRPREAELFGWKGFVVPLFHPAIGLHETRWMSVLIDDWERLKPWIHQGKWMWPIDEFSGREQYRITKTAKEVRSYFESEPEHQNDGSRPGEIL
jgi:uracil-DNA glycosylase family 4